MIVSPKYIIVSLLLTDFNLTDHTYSSTYNAYTTTSMINPIEDIFYEKFWESIIKEDCDSNSMVE